jgi:hypothetical protein
VRDRQIPHRKTLPNIAGSGDPAGARASCQGVLTNREPCPSFPDAFEIPIGVESDMKLPSRENAYIPPPKLHDYLLSKTHSVGRWKAKFFRAIGFDETNVDVLEQRLIAIAHSEDVRDVVSLKHGAKYVIEGSLQTPAGNLVQVRTVWVIDAGQDRPRFVTAYPV